MAPDQERRLRRHVDAWGLRVAQAVLAAIWDVQEGTRIGPENPWLALARAIERRRRTVC